MIQALSIVGRMKRGKTTLALSAPRPLVVFDFELGVDKVEPRYVKDRDSISVISYIKEMTDVKTRKKTTAINLWHKILVDFNEALENKDVRTIVFDTFTGVWEIRRMAYLAELQQNEPSRKNLMPQEYFIPNTDMKMLITQALIHDKILITIQHIRDKYSADGKPTGEEEPDGFKYTGDLMEVELWLNKGKDKEGIMKPYGVIKACRLCMAVEGTKIVEPTYELLDLLITARRKA
ncbi:MAG: hypothetical protein DDT40_01293 [candidate division WS2 bacterium]|nr:hypothetical protein [Candidatus Psychracetigena formicireducens]